MAKQFTRVAQGYRYCGARGRPRPRREPHAAPGAARMPRSRSTCPRTRPMRRSAPAPSGKEAANHQEIIYEGYAPHGVALLVETAGPTTPTRTVASVRNIFAKGAPGISAPPAASAFCSRKWACFAWTPPASRISDELELGFDRLRPGKRWATAPEIKPASPQLVIRGAFNDFGRLAGRHSSRSAALGPHLRRKHEYICAWADRTPRGSGSRGPGASIDKLEQDDDVQKVSPLPSA